MSNPTYNPKHYDDAVENITHVFKSDGNVLPNIDAFLSSVMQEVQELEDMMYSLIYNRLLESATGDQLDQVGSLVGEERKSLSDSEYRGFINARIAVNRSSGEIERLIWIVERIVPGIKDVHLYQLQNATVMIEYLVSVGLTDTQKTRIGQMVLEAVGAGIKLIMIEGLYSKPFGFFGNPQAGGFDEGYYSGVVI